MDKLNNKKTKKGKVSLTNTLLASQIEAQSNNMMHTLSLTIPNPSLHFYEGMADES